MDVHGGWSLLKRRGRWYGQHKIKIKGTWRTWQRALAGPDGSPIPCDAGGNRNIRAARAALDAWRAEVMGEASGPRRGENAGMDAADYVAAYVEGRAGGISGSTLRVYREYARMCRPHIAGVPISQLDAPAMRAALLSMAGAGWAPRTVRKACNLIGMACDAAVEAGDLAGNPCTKAIRRQSIRRTGAPEPNALDAEGIRRAVEAADACGSPALGAAVRLSLWAGLRRGECCALRWRDVGFGSRTIHVGRSIGVADGGTYEKGPKSYAGTRDVPMTGDLVAYLSGMRDRLAAIAGGEAAVAGLFVLGGGGRHMSPQSLSRAWAEANGASENPAVGCTGAPAAFHDLRHTFATTALGAGMDVRTLAALMGHEDPGVTLRHYAAFMPSQGRAAMDAVSGALAGR